MSERVVPQEYKELDPLWRALRVAFWDRDRWDKVRRQAVERGAVALLVWIAANEILVLDQMERHGDELDEGCQPADGRTRRRGCV